MKKLLLAVVLLWKVGLHGQIGPCTISGGSQSGELYYSYDLLPDFFSVGKAGSDNTWSFTTLSSPRTLSFKYAKASDGKFSSYFENALMVMKDPDGKETYYYKRSGDWYELGFASFESGSINPVVSKYKVPIKACVPKSMNRSSVYQTSFGQEESTTLNFKDLKDGSGVLFLPDEIYDAYRTKRIIEKTIQGVKTEEIRYLFTDQITGELLMDIQVNDKDQPTWVKYRVKEASNDIYYASSTNQFLLYPNTSYGDVRLEFLNFEEGDYIFIVHDIVGRELWRNKYTIQQNVTVKEDLSFLPRGTYTYTIIDSQQNRIATRRLAIIKS